MCRLFAALLFVGAVIGCDRLMNRIHKPSLPGSGTWGELVRELEPFREIEIHGNLSVDFAVGEVNAIRITGDDNIVARIVVDQDGDQLAISTPSDVVIEPDLSLRIVVSGRSPHRIEMHGARGRFVGIESESLEVECSGASQGAITGNVTTLDLEISGASQWDASGLQTTIASTEISGASRAALWVDQALEADVSGASHLKWTGEAQNVDTDVTGASTMDRVAPSSQPRGGKL